jgi:uncharacterized protein (TIGR03083 family)
MSDVISRSETVRGLTQEYASFATLLDGLTDADWRTSTRCTGFEVRDVAGHVVGLAEDVTRGVPGSRTAAEEAASLREYAPDEVAKVLRTASESIGALLDAVDDATWSGPSPVEGLTLGRGVLTLWYDAYVHADDIRAALGRPSERGAGLRASVEYLVGELDQRGFGPIQLTFDGMPAYGIGKGGTTVTGDPMEFVLAATGRTDPAPLGLDERVNIYAA